VTLPTLLSQTLIAFTIEFDNEWERQMTGSVARRFFLVSLPMWANFMRFVPEEGVRVRELRASARVTEASLRSRLRALERWGYVKVEPVAPGAEPRPPFRDWIVRLKNVGRRAREVWGPLGSDIEKRWEARFGAADIERLREALRAIAGRLDVELPQYLPVVGYDMFSGVEPLERRTPSGSAAGLGLSALLSHVLLAYALEFERESRLSLALAANALRVVDESGVRLRDLPSLTGLSKEAVAVSVGFLEKQGYVGVEPDPAASRTKRVRLTEKGRGAQAAYRRNLARVDELWATRFGTSEIRRLEAVLRELAGRRDPHHDRPLLAQGLVPAPGCWRASKPYLAQTTAMLRDPFASLPHFPTVLHRGGWPDGS
jgi:DNA-binding MarR family transcriptional regulator